jgi:hypothetical protein
MSVSIKVESILTAASRRPPGGPRLEALNRDKPEVLARIQSELGLAALPWEEPSERAGTPASIGQTSYSSLTALPFTLDLDARCPHLVEHDTYWTIYVPVDFEAPRVCKGGPFGSFVIGSAPRLRAELALLAQHPQFPRGMPVHDLLARAADESAALQRPLQVRW